MLIYLDTCAIQRPLDDMSDLRVRTEAEAILGIIAAVEAGSLALVNSRGLLFETERVSDPTRLRFAREVLGLATVKVPDGEAVRALASRYEATGIKPLDAAHLASAVAVGADVFCTTDRALLRMGKRANTNGSLVADPLALLDLLP